MRPAIVLHFLCAIPLTSASVGHPDMVLLPLHGHTDKESDKPGIRFSEEWTILGPFGIGTRGIPDQIRAYGMSWLTVATRGGLGF